MANKVGVFPQRSTVGPIAFGPDPGVTLLVAALCERGPVDVPTLVTSFSRFTSIFGGALSDTIGYSTGYEVIKIMFEKGVSKMYISRIVGDNALPALVNLPGGGAGADTLQVAAKGAGTWANDYEVVISTGTKTDTFKLEVRLTGTTEVIEPFDNIVMTDASRLKVNALSNLIVLKDLGSPELGALKNPVNATYTLTTQVGVDDHAPTTANVVGTETVGVKSGLKAFRDFGYTAGGVGFLMAPDLDSAADVRTEMAAQLDTFYHLPFFSGAPVGSTPTQAIADVVSAQFKGGGSYCYPRPVVIDDITGDVKPITGAGHIAADWLKSLTLNGPGKAPAGKDFKVDLVAGLETQINGQPLVDEAVAELLVGAGVTPLYDKNGSGIKVWGARSTADTPAWQYLHAGFTWAVIASTVKSGLDQVVYDNASPNLFQSIQTAVYNMMVDLHRLGAFNGAVPIGNEQPDKDTHAFAVKCSEDLLSPNDKNNGIIRVEIWFKAALTAETILVNVAKRTQG